MKNKLLFKSILFFLVCLALPVYGKTSGFREISKKRYDADCWHTYRHDASGLEVIWIENKDINKAFTIGVKTPTVDDTGVNHIIEHTVFTGSEKYPSSSVFFDASEAYPSTYMNALTSGDMTIFPFSTPYLSCYNHLRSIYLDAVFNPNLLRQPYGFYEEGFHYVPEEERSSGVVYNEMKGAYSSVDRAVYRTLRKSIYADSHYAFDSGGAPNAIPTLSYDAFLETYKRYYYPGNMKIIVYGDLPIDETLKDILSYVEKVDLTKGPKEGIDLRVQETSKIKQGTYEVLPNKEKGCLVKAFVLKEDVTAKELQQLDLWMSAYLMSPQAYFQNMLMSNGIHAKWLKDDDVPYPIYAIALTDLPYEKMETYSKLLDRLFEEVPSHLQKNIFLEQDILREAKWIMDKQETSNNRGIQVAQSILDGWAHQREENQYFLLREQLKEMTQLDRKISELLFKQAEQYTLKLLPGEYEIESPETLANLQIAEWTNIYEAIKAWQNQKVNLEAVDLESLVVKDYVTPKRIQKQNYWALETRAETDLIRSQLYLNTSHIPQEDLPYLYLYSYLLEESAKDITPFSGVISSQCTAYPLKEGYWPCFKLSITTDAKEQEHGVLFEQARRYLQVRSDSWYQQKLIEFTLNMKGASQNNVLATLSYLSLGSEGERGAYLYQQSYPFYLFCKNLLNNKQKEWIKEVKAIDQKLYHSGGTILSTTIPLKGKNKVARSWEKRIETWDKVPNLKGNYHFEIPSGTYVIYHDAPVDYCYIRLHYPEGIDGTDYLLAAYLTKHYFNPEIRVRMGAYGAGCQIYDLQTLGIYTYRDPDYQNSLSIIKQSGKCLSSEIGEEALELSKAEALNKVHVQYKLLGSPIEQSATMEHLILWGKTPQIVLNLQKDIILSTPKDLCNKKEYYENRLNEGKTAIMTQKKCTGEQNFTIYRY